MNPSDFSSSQLLQFIVMFVVLALVFAGLLVFVFTGGWDGFRKRKERKDRSVKFNLNVFEDPTHQEKLPLRTTPDSKLNRSTNPGQKESSNQLQGQINMTESKKRLLKSGGLLKSTQTDNNKQLTRSTEARSSSSIDQVSDLAEPEFSLADMHVEPLIPDRYQPVLTVLFDRETEQIVLDIDGERYENIGQVKARSIGQRILEVVALLLNFTNGMMGTLTGVKSIPVPPAKLTAIPDPSVVSQETTASPAVDIASRLDGIGTPSGMPASPIDSVTEEQPPKPRPTLEPIRPAISNPVPQPPVVTGGRRGIFGLGGKKNAIPEVPAFNLAAEINRVVQQQLESEMIHTSVKIGTARDGLLRIEVAGRVYDAVGEVEPVHIREMIQAAIQSWEQR